MAIKIWIRDLRILTVWKNRDILEAFRNYRVHLQAIKDSNKLGFNRSVLGKQITYLVGRKLLHD